LKTSFNEVRQSAGFPHGGHPNANQQKDQTGACQQSRTIRPFAGVSGRGHFSDARQATIPRSVSQEGQSGISALDPRGFIRLHVVVAQAGEADGGAGACRQARAQEVVVARLLRMRFGGRAFLPRDRRIRVFPGALELRHLP
jgi:hypothetical protein